MANANGTHINELWQNFSENTGFHGLNKLSNVSKCNNIRVAVWTCIILASSTFLIYTIITEIQMYYTYPTTFSMYTQPNTEMEFPAVTVCNLNTLNKSAMKNDSRIDNYFMSVSPLTAMSESINWSDPFYEQEGFYQHMSMADILAENKQVLDGFLFYAYFDRKLLNISTYFKVVKFSNGPCVTTNPNMALKTTYTGSWFNLNLLLFIDKENDYYGSWFGEGIQFMVHDPKDETVYRSNMGHFVEPGREVFATVNRKQLEYLPSPYKAMPDTYCQEQIGDGTDYVMSRCYKECLTKMLYTVCGCTDFTHGNETYCSKYKVATCVKDAMENITQDEEHKKWCNCPVSCKSITYDVSLTSSLFPSEFYGNVLWKNRGAENVEIFRQNYINLHIYFDQLATTVVKQVPKYATTGDVFAKFGGQMGLFLGASIITVTELGEFLLLVICSLIKRLKKNRTDATTGQEIIQVKQSKVKFDTT